MVGKPTSPKLKIGILLTESKNEAKKEEIISLRKRVPPRPWIKNIDFNVNPDFKIERQPYRLAYKDTEIPHTVGVATDVSIGEYIKHYHGEEFEVDFIRPKEISKARLEQNDINFLLIYDLLESFHTDRTRGKKLFTNFQDIIKSSTNVFPNYEYQEFIDSKLIYYEYFRDNGVPIAPTITLSKEQYVAEVAKETEAGQEGAAERVSTKILRQIQSEKWGKFIGKPVFGQEAKACKTFKSPKNAEARFAKYVRDTMSKYPGLIFQKFIDGFGQTVTCPEVRMYYVGEEYQFSIVAGTERIYTLHEEGGQPPSKGHNGRLKLDSRISLDKLKEIATRVIGVLKKKLVLKSPGGDSKNLPLLMTRVDMGCMQGDEFKPWVNEVEFVPSYYMENHVHPIDASVAEQMIHITKQFCSPEVCQAPQEEAGESNAMEIDV